MSVERDFKNEIGSDCGEQADMQGKIDFTQRVKKSRGMYGLASEYAASGKVWEKWKLLDLNSDQFDRAFTKAISRVNKAIRRSDDALMSFFWLGEGGREIPVKIENLGPTRRVKADWGNDGVKDILGVYRYNFTCDQDPDKNLEIAYTKDREIILYADKIDEFAITLWHNDSLGRKYRYEENYCDEEKFSEYLMKVIAYVLVHEVFHAYQDFHLNFAEYKKNHTSSDIEPYAEYYALRFVKNVLKDRFLFKDLCQANTLPPYSNALKQFGYIQRRESEARYFDDLAGKVEMWGRDIERYAYF